jgi:hypothetical protein
VQTNRVGGGGLVIGAGHLGSLPTRSEVHLNWTGGAGQRESRPTKLGVQENGGGGGLGEGVTNGVRVTIGGRVTVGGAGHLESLPTRLGVQENGGGVGLGHLGSRPTKFGVHLKAGGGTVMLLMIDEAGHWSQPPGHSSTTQVRNTSGRSANLNALIGAKATRSAPEEHVCSVFWKRPISFSFLGQPRSSDSWIDEPFGALRSSES